MGLPNFSGPFNVGAIDLEIPVREPRSFGTEYVPNDQINKPRRQNQKRAQHIAKSVNEKAKRAAHERHHHGGCDLSADNEQSGQGSSEDAIKDKSQTWNPLSGGAKTTTLHLSTVLFTIFYPTEVNIDTDEYTKGVKHSRVLWMGRPKHKGVAAYLSYLGQYGPWAAPAVPAILSLMMAKIPAIAGARLADPASDKARAPPPKDDVEMGNFGSEPPMFPVVIFSHGLAGTRLSYSQFCGELASHGVIVAALEHRDGSGISSIVRMPKSAEATEEDVNAGLSSTSQLKVPYFSFEKVGLRSFAEDPSEKERGLRQAQMAMRAAEIKECLYILKQIQQGKGEEIARKSTRGLTSKLGDSIAKGDQKKERSKEEARRLQLWEGKLDTDYPILCGHSFGGATVIEMQRKGPIITRQGEEEGNDESHSSDATVEVDSSQKTPFPISIILDPWVEPIQWRMEDEPADERPMLAPAYVINSETFTVWKDHFTKLKRILHDSREAVEGQHGWLMTLAGCQHLDFSDMPFLLPHVFRSTIGPKATIAIFSRATYAEMGLSRQRRRDAENLPGVKSDDMKHDLSEDHGEINTDIAKKSEKGDRVQEQEDDESIQRGNFGQGQDDLGREKADNDHTRVAHVATEEGQKLHKKEEKAAEKLWKSKEQREKERTERILQDRKKRGLKAIMANRTTSGNIEIVKASDTIDFSECAKDVAADEDAAKVHQSLEEISQHLDYKRPKIHSLMALLFRIKGMHPGIEQPGKVLIHHY